MNGSGWILWLLEILKVYVLFYVYLSIYMPFDSYIVIWSAVFRDVQVEHLIYKL